MHFRGVCLACFVLLRPLRLWPRLAPRHATTLRRRTGHPGSPHRRQYRTVQSFQAALPQQRVIPSRLLLHSLAIESIPNRRTGFPSSLSIPSVRNPEKALHSRAPRAALPDRTASPVAAHSTQCPDSRLEQHTLQAGQVAPLVRHDPRCRRRRRRTLFRPLPLLPCPPARTPLATGSLPPTLAFLICRGRHRLPRPLNQVPTASSQEQHCPIRPPAVRPRQLHRS